jgi:hypothetical protein
MPTTRPFGIGDDAVYLPDPDHIEWVAEITWISVPPHWQATTGWWTLNGLRIVRVCDADELVLADSFEDPRA